MCGFASAVKVLVTLPFLFAQSTGFRIRVDCCGIIVLVLAAIGGWYVFSDKKGGNGR